MLVVQETEPQRIYSAQRASSNVWQQGGLTTTLKGVTRYKYSEMLRVLGKRVDEFCKFWNRTHAVMATIKTLFVKKQRSKRAKYTVGNFFVYILVFHQLSLFLC